MKNYEKLLNLFKDYLKNVEEEQLKKMADGVYIFTTNLINLSKENEKLFKINSFPKNMKNLIIDMEIATYEELKRRR